MGTTIRWGVLGAAAIAVERTLPAMKKAPSAELAALASRDPAKGRRIADALGIARVHASYEALLADPHIDAVYVPLPNRLHFEWSVRALEAGKHVLCEKPLCMRADEVRRLIEVRDRCGRHIEEAFAYRNHPQWEKLDELLARGAIGAPRSAHLTLAKRFMDPADIRNQLEQGGGALYDLGSYALDAIGRVFRRAPRRVVAALDRDPQFGTDRLSSVLLDYGDAHALLTVGTQAGTAAWGTHQQFSVMGETGWLRMDFPYAHARSTACTLELGDASSVGSLPTETFRFEPADHYVLQIERFSQLLLGEPVASHPIEQSLAIATITEAIFASAQSGGWQAVDRQAPHLGA
ncbi:Gfo/Idh/MocA family protein [Piscinibacter koreensis]|uniref:Gfo/Idh/MocA family oxidoreductase n=1 Tax=Piscinibacter koreensis TaxID=2742824 RepID=A0A7Y6NPB2_9BURK|nr:Gfo/Idh/MocA family oxidoreductase [Schlegelella koreensis]NUZ06863.1 Gfo/Idh/MocA family oxidoreductase [Schlegelella koreensis]